MGKRREPRVQLDIPVKVCGMDTARHPFVQTAYAISVSRAGVRLTGVGSLLRVGEVVVVMYKQKKARFRVVWIGELGHPEAGQAGLQTVESSSTSPIWDFALPFPAKDGYQSPDEMRGNAFSVSAAAVKAASSELAAAPAPLGPVPRAQPDTERRTAPRFKCRGSADIFVPGVSFPTRGQIDDISLSGVYIQTTAPLLIKSAVTLHLAMLGFDCKAEAEVRTSHPGVGMGLMFTGMDTENRMILGAIINKLGGVPAPAPRTAASVGAQTEPAQRPQAITPRWDALAREISEWFRTHDNLSREEFFALLRRQ